ncbi:MAG: hypothetical protein ACXVCY_04325 [Pseudobdellovibrionaceae bacterium]
MLKVQTNQNAECVTMVFGTPEEFLETITRLSKALLNAIPGDVVMVPLAGKIVICCEKTAKSPTLHSVCTETIEKLDKAN